MACVVVDGEAEAAGGIRFCVEPTLADDEAVGEDGAPAVVAG